MLVPEVVLLSCFYDFRYSPIGEAGQSHPEISNIQSRKQGLIVSAVFTGTTPAITVDLDTPPPEIRVHLEYHVIQVPQRDFQMSLV